MDKRKIINTLVDFYSGGDNGKFAKKLGIAPQTLSTWKARGTLDYDVVYANCEDLNANWLLSGKGNMLLAKTSPKSKEKGDGKKIEVDADFIVSLLEVIRDDQKEILANFEKIQGVSSLSSAMREDGLDNSDVEALIAKERARIAAGERGARNAPVKQKVSEKK